MKCPHCLEHFHSRPLEFGLSGGNANLKDADGQWSMTAETCPSCLRAIIHLVCRVQKSMTGPTATLVHPKSIARKPIPPEVPAGIADDYREACLVLPDSTKASAALSRRCLQHLLRDAAKANGRDLIDQIKEVLPHLPSYLAEMIDSVRAVGNFAAHPMKSTNTGEIIAVEPGEADLLLDTLEMAFDFYYVQPAEAKRKRDALNAKLAEVGKPPLK